MKYLLLLLLSFSVSGQVKKVPDTTIVAVIDGNDFNNIEEFQQVLANNLDFTNVCNLDILLECLKDTKYQGLNWKHYLKSKQKLKDDFDKIINIFNEYIKYNKDFLLILTDEEMMIYGTYGK